MFVKFLGIIDLFVGVSYLIIFYSNNIQNSFILIIGIILLLKGLIFISSLNFASIMDAFLGLIIIISSSINMPIWIVLPVSIFLVQKGIFSMI